MTDPTDDAPPTADVQVPHGGLDTASPPLSAIEVVAELFVELYGSQPQLALRLRAAMRECSFRELACLFGAQAIADAVLSGSTVMMPVGAAGEPVDDGTPSADPPHELGRVWTEERERLHRSGGLVQWDDTGKRIWPPHQSAFGWAKQYEVELRPRGATHMSD
jgi:hypothetical protein